MHAGRYYSLFFTLAATLPAALNLGLGWRWLSLPWVPVALIGTALAFITGFKNNASYDRLWEARKIWGGIVNVSRQWASAALTFPAPEPIAPAARSSDTPDDTLRLTQRLLVMRHIAWLTAPRYQLRTPREWELLSSRFDYQSPLHIRVEEWDDKLDQRLVALLPHEDALYVLGKQNRATHLLALQARTLDALALRGALSDYRRVEMQRLLNLMFDLQGMCERIKNFPYPRQFATLNRTFMWLFVALVPLGLLHEFAKNDGVIAAFMVPASVIVGWVFYVMEKIGAASENPFEGSANDVPITALSRTIEIDLREMLDDESIPASIAPVNEILL
jgi:putative membrane protein